jgi:hypothetical protein
LYNDHYRNHRYTTVLRPFAAGAKRTQQLQRF